MVYRDKAGRRTERRVWPLAVVFLEDRQALLAWCCLRQDFRQFILSQIETALPADALFRPRRVTLLRDYLDRLRGSAP